MTIPELPQGYTSRNPTWEDLEAVHALWQAVEAVDEGEDTGTLDDLRGQWEMERFDLKQGAWLVLAPDRALVAYGEIWPREGYVVINADGNVHPDHRAKGLGRWLVQTMEARARIVAQSAAAGERVLLHNTVNHAIRPQTALLESEGYRPARYFWRMVIELDKPPAESPVPEGVAIRTFKPEDERPLYELIKTAFADNEGPPHSPFDEWRTAMIDREAFNPALFFIAEAGGEIVGAALCPDYEGEGWIRQVAVSREYRGRGIAHALLRHAFARQYEHGNRRVGLAVDSYNRTNAKAVYERAGMHNEHQFDAYEKVLRDA